MGEPGQHPAEQIEDQIPEMPQTVLDIVTKDPEEQHVAKDVRDAAVHEHRGDQREIHRNRRWLQARHLDSLTGERMDQHAIASYDVSVSDDLARDSRERIREPFVCPEALEKNKYQNIGED